MCGACIESQFIIGASARAQLALDTETAFSRLSNATLPFETSAFMMETPLIQLVLDLWRHDPVVALCRLMEGSIDGLELNVPEELLVEAHEIFHAPAALKAAEAWEVPTLTQPPVQWLSGKAPVPMSLDLARSVLEAFSMQWLWEPETLAYPDASTAVAAGEQSPLDLTSLEQPDDPTIAKRSAQVIALFPTLYLAFCLLRQSASDHREFFLPIAFGLGRGVSTFHGLDLWLRRQALVVVVQQWQAAVWEKRESLGPELIAYCAERLTWPAEEKAAWLNY